MAGLSSVRATLLEHPVLCKPNDTSNISYESHVIREWGRGAASEAVEVAAKESLREVNVQPSLLNHHAGAIICGTLLRRGPLTGKDALGEQSAPAEPLETGPAVHI
jgi:hypothetical protein